MTADIPRYYVGRHFADWAVYDVLHNTSPALSVHKDKDDAQAAADIRNTPRRTAATRPTQDALFSHEEATA